jgi:hypothetical protein
MGKFTRLDRPSDELGRCYVPTQSPVDRERSNVPKHSVDIARLVEDAHHVDPSTQLFRSGAKVDDVRVIEYDLAARAWAQLRSSATDPRIPTGNSASLANRLDHLLRGAGILPVDRVEARYVRKIAFGVRGEEEELQAALSSAVRIRLSTRSKASSPSTRSPRSRESAPS